MAIIAGAVVAIVVIIVTIAFFYNSPVQQPTDVITQAQTEATNTVIIGTIHENAGKQIARFQPTADYIASKLGENYAGKVVVARDDAEMVELLKNQQIDLYFDSPFIAASVSQDSGAVPMLIRWKEGVEEYNSVFVVRNDSSITSLADLVGKTLAFEVPESTSGYLLPASHLMQQGLEMTEGNGDGDKVRYMFTGDDENTALWVVEGRADAGAFSNIDLLQTPNQLRKQLRVVAETASVPRQIVLHRADMDPANVQNIKGILLAMERDQEGKRIMDEFDGTTRYTEAADDILKDVFEMVARVKS